MVLTSGGRYSISSYRLICACHANLSQGVLPTDHLWPLRMSPCSSLNVRECGMHVRYLSQRYTYHDGLILCFIIFPLPFLMCFWEQQQIIVRLAFHCKKLTSKCCSSPSILHQSGYGGHKYLGSPKSLCWCLEEIYPYAGQKSGSCPGHHQPKAGCGRMQVISPLPARCGSEHSDRLQSGKSLLLPEIWQIYMQIFPRSWSRLDFPGL